ncbi:MAG: SOS response-associated peptidase [Bacteroidetes bacterium]|nr:SOS response-associated peptidase [Bacteroidota bacterium]
MCYHYAIKTEKKTLEQKTNLLFEDNNSWKSTEKINCFTLPMLPVVLNEDKKQLKLLQWGLVPFWSKTSKLDVNLANAKCEDIFEKPSWKNPILNRRCLIPATGFFEWKLEGKKKIPYFIYLPNQTLFYFGGIWDRWINNSTGETIESFSIITTPANTLMEEIHNTKKRMPLIISDHLASEWLVNNTNKSEISNLLVPYDSHLMRAEKTVERPIKGDIPGTLTLF